ncbi:MAG TPA: hypothetical protein VIP11_22065 [Gemmatimonadaceae bacterium]
MGIRQAQRVRTAHRFIKAAFGIDAARDPRVCRVELLGDCVAVARVRVPGCTVPRLVVARRQSTGRVIRLRRESRADLATLGELVSCLEHLYARFGGPNGEPPRA